MTETLLGPRFPELRALVLDVALRRRMKRWNGSTHVTEEGLRKGASRFTKAMQGRRLYPPMVKVEETTVGDLKAEWIRVDTAGKAPREDKVVLYFHGGGFFMSSPAEHRPITWRIARATRRPLFAVAYRKAPDHVFPTWIDDALAAYDHLLAKGFEGRDILVSGDSAGGNIAVSLTHRIRRTGRPQPGGLVLFSPWLDMLCEGKTFTTNAFRDAMFQAPAVRALGRYLTRDCDPADPEVSPIHGNFEGFPPVLVLAGSTEVFLDDSRTLVQRARAAGVPVEFYVYRHLPHVFPMFAGLIPRAKSAFRHIEEFADTR